MSATLSPPLASASPRHTVAGAGPLANRDPLLTNVREEPDLVALLETARVRHEAFRRRFAP